ncbi:hypothetical protein ACER0A_001240 [Haloimpatiens sp. FM7315]|uniref:hypothetical protein n=1 Tax=Haloimpatiens sp. FM7315 TaxID=3298609 RepID=UPI0035A33A52
MFKDKMDRILKSIYRNHQGDISGLNDEDIPELKGVLDRFEKNLNNNSRKVNIKKKRFAIAAAILAIVSFGALNNSYDLSSKIGQKTIFEFNKLALFNSKEKDRSTNSKTNSKENSSKGIDNKEISKDYVVTIKKNKKDLKDISSIEDKPVSNIDKDKNIQEINKGDKDNFDNNIKSDSSVNKGNPDEYNMSKSDNDIKNSSKKENIAASVERNNKKNLKDKGETLDNKKVVAALDKGTSVKNNDKLNNKTIKNEIEDIENKKDIEDSSKVNKEEKETDVKNNDKSEKVETEKIGDKIVCLVYENGILKGATWNSGNQKFTMILRQYMSKDEVIKLIEAY